MRKMRYATAAIFALAFFVPSFAVADSFGYHVMVDTSSLSGMAGNLEFQFTPGVPAPFPASATIFNFAGPALNGVPSTSGPVSGKLSDEVTFDNSAAGDYFQPIVYHSALSFTVAFSETPNPALGGNSFAFSMFDNATPPNPVLTTDLVNGFAFTVDLPNQGNPILTNHSAETTLVFFTPEPGSAALLLVGIAVGMGLRHFARNRVRVDQRRVTPM